MFENGALERRQFAFEGDEGPESVAAVGLTPQMTGRYQERIRDRNKTRNAIYSCRPIERYGFTDQLRVPVERRAGRYTGPQL